ncbi:hypothetical protein CLV35_0761 [Motilibacter peucedani]|uniref:Uncharacterized protein n=1 Tax=Motilibacter peucedani TaxID=598650 RepID=A0A420XU10_9ACTN|nr:hypothetical protein [Motilibacter peucedani]RKS80333.1 hypothetical protein CLV35_0761 [Motilibacter peucedani]
MVDTLCPSCGSRSPDVLDVLTDQRRRYSCQRCGEVWVAGDPQPVPRAAGGRRPAVQAYSRSRADFPTPEQVEPDRRARVEALKARFLAEHPAPEPRVAEFWATYQRVFAEDGLDRADPKAFHFFANSPVGAYAGQMTVFNNEWKDLGPREGARRVAESVRFLLYGPEDQVIEDRLTYLVQPGCPIGMKGWKEALLTKVLCIVEPDRFLPIVTYGSPDVGKRALARSIWGLELPAADRTSMTLGRLVVWSNDLLRALAGDGFAHAEHASSFLWWAKDFAGDLAGAAPARAAGGSASRR